MEEGSKNSVDLVEALAKTEIDYFYDCLNRSEMLSIIKRIAYDVEETIMKFNRDRDAKSMISLFLILERLKKYLVFENFVIGLVESELNVLATNFDLLTLTQHDNDNDKSGSNDEIRFELIQSNISNKKHDASLYCQRIKNKRANYPKKVSRILKNWLKENMNNPYPSESEKIMLMEFTGLDATQINNWFINARRRILPYMKSKYIKYD